MALLRKAPFFLGLYLLSSFLIFAAIEAIPGDPIALRFGKSVDPERVALERERLGLDRPYLWRYLASQGRFLSGDWGRSLSTGRETSEDVALFLPATIELSALAMAIGIGVGMTVALFAALGSHPWVGRLAHLLASIGLIVPIFWIGIALLMVGGLWLEWFPMGGRFDMMAVAPDGPTGLLLVDALLRADFAALAIVLRHLALPAICLSFFPAASVTSVAYARLKEPELQAFITALRSRGFGSGRILGRHLLRVAATPVVTVIGTTFGALLGGAFLTETVFSWPGIGRYLVNAILSRDVFVAQNLLTFLVLLVIVVAFVSDLLVWRLDPKRHGRKGGAS
ncbi:ABC transporter permease [Pelagicoccus sp. SDUM812003]|uniref:ABC transporter permease n=1 Tax=Pelagicoccus sp. SDUM812003 TaxID=3041267 RepID=UPI00280E2C97|nr:ABC transporter permease [Pelagicoccus sp. SDUM812003]MDQ8203527.1 ABC transporter permease [Pelagicoccus sp. SDUM812003]